MNIFINDEIYTLKMSHYIEPRNTSLVLESQSDPTNYRKLTVNVPFEFASPRAVAIKNYSENENWIDQFLSLNLLAPIGVTVKSGFVDIPIYMIHPETYETLLNAMYQHNL